MQSLFYGNGDDDQDQPNPSFSGQSAQPQPNTQAWGAPSQGNAGTQGGGGQSLQQQPTQGIQRMSTFSEDVGIHITNCSSVKEYAQFEDPNRQFRQQMEDTFCHMDKVANDQTCGMFGVFDGHGGLTVSEHCAEMFPIEMRKDIQKNPQELYQTMEAVFKKIDGQVAMMDSDHCGSTACVAVVRREINHNVLYVANAGDTRAVISKNGVAERLSKDHKASDAQEAARVKAEGGSIMDGRVAGGLAITRAIGDHAFKNFGVTCLPYTVRHVLRPFDKFLVIASDGIWDVISDEDAVALCKEELNTKQIAQQIVKAALDKGSGDNISVIVVKFNSGNIF